VTRGSDKSTGRDNGVVAGSYHSSVPELKLEIQMLQDRILVKLAPEEGERRSSGGIVIPATAQMARRLAWGDVLGVGVNVRNIKVGDRVLFNPEDQFEVEVGGQNYLVMRERDLHAVATERTEHGTGLYL
jgi:chaperonin GroES